MEGRCREFLGTLFLAALLGALAWAQVRTAEVTGTITEALHAPGQAGSGTSHRLNVTSAGRLELSITWSGEAKGPRYYGDELGYRSPAFLSWESPDGLVKPGRLSAGWLYRGSVAKTETTGRTTLEIPRPGTLVLKVTGESCSAYANGVEASDGRYTRLRPGSYRIDVRLTPAGPEGQAAAPPPLARPPTPKPSPSRRPPLDVTVDVDPSPLVADGYSVATLTVRVTSAGQPVPGAEVTFRQRFDAGTLEPPRGRTGRDGTARFRYTAPRTEDVPALAGARSAGQQFTAVATHDGRRASGFVVLSLARVARVEVYVHDLEGKPVAGQRVLLAWEEGGDRKIREVMTGSNGRSSYVLPEGTPVQVLFRPEGYLAVSRQARCPDTVDLLRTSVEEFTRHLQDLANRMLARVGYTEEQIRARQARFVHDADHTQYQPWSREIHAYLAMTNVEDLLGPYRGGDLAHEMGHHMSAAFLDPDKNVGAGREDIYEPVDSADLAFEEATADLVADLLLRPLVGGYKEIPLQEIRRRAAQHDRPGDLVEANVAGFLNAWYGERMARDPAGVFEDFHHTLQRYRSLRGMNRPARTIQEFLDVKLHDQDPGLPSLDDPEVLARAYGIVPGR